MGSQLDQLSRLLTPPGTAVSVPPWDLSLMEVGFEFPRDYREFIGRYGSGRLSSTDKVVELAVVGPTTTSSCASGSGFTAFVENTTGNPPDFIDEYEEGIPYVSFPGPGSLLEWGFTDNGDRFFWLVEGRDPDAWTVVEMPRSETRTYRFNGGMVDYLLALMRQQFPTARYYIGSEARWTVCTDWLRTYDEHNS
jgi:hypothetical protein